jgi:RHS repeat-associated protein
LCATYPSLTYSNGLALAKTFTLDYRLDALQVQDVSTSTVVLDRFHAFGDSLNLTGITDNITSARTESYAYTATNRLAQGTGIWGTLTWGYDSVGNRASEALAAGPTDTYNYPGTSNKLATVTQGATTTRAFTHDGAGNVTADDRAGTIYNYRYNQRNRLDRLTIGSTVTADYTYDGLERLAIRTTQNMTPASTTHYVYDLSGRLIAEATATGTTLREYVWLDDLPLALVADVDTMSPNLYFVHADHLDRPLKMTDASQAIVWDAVYRPFGDMHSITGTAANNLRFPGQYFLMEAGLHYNWYRHYDPTIGRYLQTDPLGFVDGPSRYAYARGNPVSYVDPRGLWIDTIADIGFIAYDLYLLAKEGTCNLSDNLVALGLDVAAAVIPGIIGAGSAFRAGKRFTPDQQALVELAKEAKKLGGMTETEVQIMRKWGNEYDVLVRGPESHPGRGFGSEPHVHVGPVNHIPIIP